MTYYALYFILTQLVDHEEVKEVIHHGTLTTLLSLHKYVFH